MVERVVREARTLDDFRALWVRKQARARLIDHLLADRYNPDFLRHIDQMTDYDLYDILAHHGYRAGARTREGRESAYLAQNEPWFSGLPEKTVGAIVLKPADVLKRMGGQFARAGTEALESSQLWNLPRMREVGGLEALALVGKPQAVVLDAKNRLFSA